MAENQYLDSAGLAQLWEDGVFLQQSDATAQKGVAGYGANGLVPRPLIGDSGKFLRADGTWAEAGGGGGGSYVLGAAYTSSYTGTGTYGSSNPNTLTFPTAPATVIVQVSVTNAQGAIFQQGCETAFCYIVNSGSQQYWRKLHTTWSDNGRTLSWYASEDAPSQLNASNSSYVVSAIGTGQVAASVDVDSTVDSLPYGDAPTVTNQGTSTNAILHFGIPAGATGPTGATGNGIASVTLVSTVGKVKTYRITFTDTTTFDFQVTDGADGSGSGDMEKSTYDTNDDGVVDSADSASVAESVVDNTGSSSGIEFGLDANGKGQYRAVGASTWTPFLTGGSAFDSLDTDNCFHFGTEQSDEFANNGTKTYTLTGLEAGKEYMMIPVQVVATGTPHMWIGGNSYTQTFNGATLEESKSNNVLTFQRISVTSNNPTMTIKNTSGYRNRFCIFVFLL